MFAVRSSRARAIAQAFFVTFLWSTSWVFIKIGLADLPPLVFAGLRYVLAFLILLPFALRVYRHNTQTLSLRRYWPRLILLGLVLYGVTQGAQFLSLYYLPAITTSLLLSFSALITALMGIALLGERPGLSQWLGLGLYLAGALLYFMPAAMPSEQWLGVAIALIGVAANALSSVLGREINRSRTLEPVLITTVSMGIGGVALLGIGLAVQGWPSMNWTSWAIVIWLAIANTAFAFTLWNRTLTELSAVESSLINNSMLIQIPLLAVFILGETLAWREGVGLLVAGIGILTVQLQGARKVHPLPVAKKPSMPARG